MIDKAIVLLSMGFMFICDFEMITMNSLEQQTKMYLFENEAKINKTDQNAFDGRGYIECIDKLAVNNSGNSMNFISKHDNHFKKYISCDLLFDARIQTYYIPRR